MILLLPPRFCQLLGVVSVSSDRAYGLAKVVGAKERVRHEDQLDGASVHYANHPVVGATLLLLVVEAGWCKLGRFFFVFGVVVAAFHLWNLGRRQQLVVVRHRLRHKFRHLHTHSHTSLRRPLACVVCRHSVVPSSLTSFAIAIVVVVVRSRPGHRPFHHEPSPTRRRRL